MLKFEKLTKQHKDRFNEVIKRYNYRNSQSSFTSLYIWSKFEDTEIAFGENAMFLKFLFEGETVYFSPFLYDMEAPIKPALRELRNYLHKENEPYCIKGGIKEHKEKIEKEFDQFYMFKDRDNFDYVYESEKLINLSGKKLSSKRNHINYFLNNYDYEYKEYDSSLKDECIDLIEKWHEAKGDVDGLDLEVEVLKNLLDSFDDLDIHGAVVYVDGNIEALTFGEKLSSDTALIHMEKANAEIRGLYPFINQQFVINQWSDYKYINREEDMGLEGLRRAKESYQPAFMVEKYSFSLDGKCDGY